MIIEDNNNINLSDFEASTSKSTNRASGQAVVMSVVYAESGIRITIPNAVFERLDSPEIVQVSFKEDYMAIGQSLPDNNSSFTIKKSGNKAIIYYVNLVKDIISYFNLDFSDKTSITCYEVLYTSYDEKPVAIIKVR